MNNKKRNLSFGFTLVEIIVAMGLFVTVLLVAVSALLSMTALYRVVEGTRLTIDNLNFTFEDIAKNMRIGINFHCGSGALDIPLDCVGGGTSVAFQNYKGQLSGYRFQESGVSPNILGWIDRFECPSAIPCSPLPWQRITSAQIDVDRFLIYVLGAPENSPPGTDLVQPRAFIVLQGTTLGKAQERVPFDLQTFISQRIFDS